MQYMCYDLKELEQGQIIEVELAAAANVKLMDAANYAQYQVGRLNRYVGGRVTRSPYRVLVPRADHWYCIVEGGSKHAVRVLPASMASSNQPPKSEPTLPPAPPARPQGTQAPRAPAAPTVRDKRFDVFLCHASEDADVAKELSDILKARGIRAGYDGFDLNIGDNLGDIIEKGLKRSKIGVVIISRSLVKKGWSGRALDRVLAVYQRSLIPVWHHITAEEVIDYNAAVAKRAAQVASRRTIYDVADEIASRLRVQ